LIPWLNNPKEALLKIKSLLKPTDRISVLDYNHGTLGWTSEPPESMRTFYKIFLKWRADAGMNNSIADDLPKLFKEIGLSSIQKFKFRRILHPSKN